MYTCGGAKKPQKKFRYIIEKKQLMKFGEIPVTRIKDMNTLKSCWIDKQWWESQKSATSKNMALYTLNISQQKQSKAMKKDNKRKRCNEENESLTGIDYHLIHQRFQQLSFEEEHLICINKAVEKNAIKFSTRFIRSHYPH